MQYITFFHIFLYVRRQIGHGETVEDLYGRSDILGLAPPEYGTLYYVCHIYVTTPYASLFSTSLTFRQELLKSSMILGLRSSEDVTQR